MASKGATRADETITEQGNEWRQKSDIHLAFYYSVHVFYKYL
jgi:hypothetical protein